MGMLDDRLAIANAYWDRWIAGGDQRAPRWFDDEPADVPNPLPSFDHAFEALMHTDYPVLPGRLKAIFEDGPALAPSEKRATPGHDEARLWWRCASVKTAPGRGAGRWDHAFDVARHAIAHFERQGEVVWGEEPLDPSEDTWLYHRDSLSFWNALRHTVESEQHRNYDGWSAERSNAVQQLHRCLEQGYAPWALLHQRSTWWWRPHGFPEHTAEHHRAESTLALEAWHWALTHQGPAPSPEGMSQALSAIGMKDGWSWSHALRAIERMDALDWPWALNHDGQDPLAHWLETGRHASVKTSDVPAHQARLTSWEARLLRRGLPISPGERSRPRL